MITLNGKPVEIGSFPDGTILMKQGKLLGAPTEWLDGGNVNDQVKRAIY